MKDSIINRYEPHLYAMDIPYNQVIKVLQILRMINFPNFLYLYFFSNYISENELFYQSGAVWRFSYQLIGVDLISIYRVFCMYVFI